jgi:hypothetical protein
VLGVSDQRAHQLVPPNPHRQPSDRHASEKLPVGAPSRLLSRSRIDCPDGGKFERRHCRARWLPQDDRCRQ